MVPPHGRNRITRCPRSGSHSVRQFVHVCASFLQHSVTDYLLLNPELSLAAVFVTGGLVRQGLHVLICENLDVCPFVPVLEALIVVWLHLHSTSLPLLHGI